MLRREVLTPKGVKSGSKGPEVNGADRRRKTQPGKSRGKKASTPASSQSDYVTMEQAREIFGDDVKLTTMSLRDLAKTFDFANPQKFKQAVLESGRLQYARLSRKRFIVRKSDLPTGN